MSSPPSPMTPPTPPEVYLARIEAERRRKAEVEKKELFISLTVNILKPFTSDQFMSSLSYIINNNSIDLEKRFKVANAINDGIANKDLNVRNYRVAVKRKFLQDVFTESSDLYKALNFQRNWPPITIGGPISLFSYNYSRSLQTAHVSANQALSAPPKRSQLNTKFE